ncbi:hypothetical protein PGIGA_G00108220 [Pangasianodon gigas]|uniref:Uncharacterized protein n=1 Tax=Pangasianodon gigas TaxID=30993 RepID=A0ACC5W902_PANGG|nr:hypothetical protein [Pangasianodon gigas]
MMPSIFTRAPAPLAAKQPQSTTDPPPYFTVDIRCFSLPSSFSANMPVVFKARKMEKYLAQLLWSSYLAFSDYSFVIHTVH